MRRSNRDNDDLLRGLIPRNIGGYCQCARGNVRSGAYLRAGDRDRAGSSLRIAKPTIVLGRLTPASRSSAPLAGAPKVIGPEPALAVLLSSIELDHAARHRAGHQQAKALVYLVEFVGAAD